MTPRRLTLARAASVVAIAAGAFYLAWRAPGLSGVGPMGWLLYAAELGNYVSLALIAILVWSPRWRPPPPPLHTSLDVLIPVCGEDPRIVEHSIRAVMAIEYPHRTIVCNDGRLLGRPHWREIEALCDELGVTCLTRTWGLPGKAGNLNFALAHSDAEIVAVIDADHEARPDFGELTIGYFADPRMAFVATKQAFVVETRDTLGQQELFFYDSVQPGKDAHNSAFSCGNGALYRRTALDGIGGFAEWNVVEDLTTSYELHARGWRSAYVPTRATVGLAPLTAAEFSRQRLRWATDSLRLFFWDNPLLKRGLSGWQRLHYLQTTSWYLASALSVVFLAAPAAWAFFGVTALPSGSGASYVLHLLPYLLALAAFMVAHAGWRGALRPMQTQLYLAPAYVLAVVYALFFKEVSGVTSKGREKRINLPMALQQATLVVLLVAIGFGLAAGGDAGVGVLLWGCLLAATIANPATMITRRRDDAQALRVGVTSLIAITAATMLVATWAPAPGAFLPGGTAQGSSARTGPGSEPPVALRPPREGAYLGAYSRELTDSKLSLTRWQRTHGGRLRIVHTFRDWWGRAPGVPARWMRAVGKEGATPMITWEPWRKPSLTVHDPNQRRGVLHAIAAGRHDRYARRFARAVAAHRRPVLIRFAHEMNGSWYPWGVDVGRNTPRAYVRAWRRVHRIFDRAGAANASWVWSIDAVGGGRPTPRAKLETYYPGDRYVDWVGLSAFNWGEGHPYGGWLWFREAVEPAYRVVAGFGKPVMLAETGTAGTGAKARAWVRDALRTVRVSYPRMKALVFYDARHPEQDFRLGPAERAGLRAGARAPFWHRAQRLVERPSRRPGRTRRASPREGVLHARLAARLR
jgi:cellulose synthase (UDP-forming)